MQIVAQLLKILDIFLNCRISTYYVVTKISDSVDIVRQTTNINRDERYTHSKLEKIHNPVALVTSHSSKDFVTTLVSTLNYPVPSSTEKKTYNLGQNVNFFLLCLITLLLFQ